MEFSSYARREQRTENRENREQRTERTGDNVFITVRQGEPVRERERERER